MHIKRLLSLAMALFMLFSITAPAFAEGEELFRLTFAVEPADARIRVYERLRTEDGSKTDYSGAAALSYDQLHAGAYHYVITADGYEPAEADFDISADRTITVTLKAIPAPEPEPP